jgi:ABC-type branched-subunit amino acid transport system substrate-binding protein
VGPATLTLGSVAAQGDYAEAGDAVKAVLTGYFDEVNERGGIYHRRISMRFAEAGGDRAATIKNATQLLDGRVFALVAPFLPGEESELAELAHEKKVPVAGLLALSVPDDPANREVFYLLPGFEQLVQELSKFAVQHQKADPAKSAVIFSDNSYQKELAPAVHAVWKELGPAAPVEFIATAENRAQLVGDLQRKGIDSVFFLGAGEEALPWIQASANAQWFPKVFLLGPLLDNGVLSSPAQLQGKMFAVYPGLEPNLEGLHEFDEFLERHHLTDEHRLLLMSAYCSAKVLETALTRAGKDLTREKLVLALEQLHDFHTGLFPAITFGPNRRIGSTKAELVCVDVVAHAFEPTCSEPRKGE